VRRSPDRVACLHLKREALRQRTRSSPLPFQRVTCWNCDNVFRASTSPRRNAISFRRIHISICTPIYLFVAIFAPAQAVPAHSGQRRDGGPTSSVSAPAASAAPPVIVIGFVGGFIRHDDPVHSEVQLAARLRKAYPTGVDVETFESYHGENAERKSGACWTRITMEL
jgi:hypothetical protein